MSGTKGPYSHDTKWMMVTMVREGRSPRSLAEEFEPSEQTIRNWVKQADLDEGRRNDGMTTDVLTQVRRLERDNKRLRGDREILRRAVAWFAARSRYAEGAEEFNS